MVGATSAPSKEGPPVNQPRTQTSSDPSSESLKAGREPPAQSECNECNECSSARQLLARRPVGLWDVKLTGEVSSQLTLSHTSQGGVEHDINWRPWPVGDHLALDEDP